MAHRSRLNPKIVCFGSLNIDHVYRVTDIARRGETIASDGYQRYLGGKGFNQSIAAAAAGGAVCHAGCVGADGAPLIEALERRGINHDYVREVDAPTGHALIQVADSGENAIVIYGGANRQVTTQHIEETMAACAPNDIVLLQNEINDVATIMRHASDSGLALFFNAAPCDGSVEGYPLALIDALIVNEVEGSLLSGATGHREIMDRLIGRFPGTEIILTLGAEGACWGRDGERVSALAPRVEPVDTTGAGDTFVGYWAASVAAGAPPAEALAVACRAASLSVGRRGAAQSIPDRAEVEQFLPFDG